MDDDDDDDGDDNSIFIHLHANLTAQRPIKSYHE
jgi:hypothetical protein